MPAVAGCDELRLSAWALESAAEYADFMEVRRDQEDDLTGEVGASLLLFALAAIVVIIAVLVGSSL